MIYHVDGFTIDRNPSPVGGGYTVFDESNRFIKREEIRKAGFTNNEGELLGVIEALILCSTGDKIITDSLNTIRWLHKGKSKARPDLNLALKLAKCLKETKQVEIEWQPREVNLAGIYNDNFVETPLLDLFVT